MFYYYLLFQLTNEINMAIITLYTLQTKLRIMHLSRSWWWTCRACCSCRARCDVLCLACCTACV